MGTIVFRLQVYYCCWEQLMLETTAQYPNAQIDLIFSGGSRQHHKTCVALSKREPIQRSELDDRFGI